MSQRRHSHAAGAWLARPAHCPGKGFVFVDKSKHDCKGKYVKPLASECCASKKKSCCADDSDSNDYWQPCHAEYRTFDGSKNNKKNPTWGKANEQLLRKAPPAYADGVSSLAERGGANPNPRDISNAVVQIQPVNSVPIPNALGLSDMWWVFGQFVDHEVDLTEGVKPPEPANVTAPANDPALPNATIAFNRSIWDPSTGTNASNPRQQINEISAYIDASNVYGSDEQRARAMRLFDGTGRLKSQCGPDGPLPPYNEGDYPNASLPGQPPSSMYLCGDVRANENAALLSMHTLFMREHNRLAKELAREHPEWRGNDERLYQEARRIVSGIMQAIVFNEFLPALLGGKRAIPKYRGYDRHVNAGIVTEFSTALYRLGHTMVSQTLRVEERQCGHGGGGSVSAVALDDIFFKPAFVKENGIEGILLGATNQRQQEVDVHIIETLRSRLFGPPANNMLLDLAVLNIQRGRDHGLPGYNAVRQAYGLAPKASVNDMTTNASVRQHLIDAYGGDEPDVIDPWVGALAEDHVDAATGVGELLQVALLEQFGRLRDGDRFWFENDPSLPKWRKREINATRLSDVLVRNTCLTRKQVRKDVFHVRDAPRLHKKNKKYDHCSQSSDSDSSSSGSEESSSSDSTPCVKRHKYHKKTKRSSHCKSCAKCAKCGGSSNSKGRRHGRK